MEDIAKIEKMSPHRGQVHAVAPLRGQWRNRQHRGRIRHECLFVDHPFTNLRIVTEFWKEGPFLTTSSDYEFEMGADKSPKKTQLDLKTLYTFPDESLGSWMREFFQEAGSKFSGWPDDRSLTLLGEGSSRNFQIRTFRNLGDQEWPNKDWIRNCCKSRKG